MAEAVQSVFGSAVPVLVGASLGGYIALMYAAKFPVKGLLLVSPAHALMEDLVAVLPQIQVSSQDNLGFTGQRCFRGRNENLS